MTNFLRLFLTASLVYFSNIAFANAIPYFRGSSLTPTLLEEPFKINSAERKKEIEEIIKLQSDLNEAELTQASAEYFMRPENVIQPTLPNLTRKNYPQTFRLLDSSEETAQEAKDVMKNYWKIPRPYKADRRIKKVLATKPASNNAYPSGHTARSYTVAYVAGLLFPENRAEFILNARQITERRVLIGEHFPSDLSAGRKLALMVVGGLIQNSEFQRDLEAAKEEVKRNSKKHLKAN